eukprot:UN01718
MHQTANIRSRISWQSNRFLLGNMSNGLVEPFSQAMLVIKIGLSRLFFGALLISCTLDPSVLMLFIQV